MNTNSKLLVLAITIFFVISCTLPAFTSTPTTDFQIPETGNEAKPTVTSLLDVLPTMTSQSEASPTASLITEQTSTIVILPTNPIPYVYAPQNTNCRIGPNVIYEAIGYLLKDETSEIVARNSQGTWVAIKNPDGSGTCYVSLAVVEVYGIDSIMTLIAFTPPPPPPTFTHTSQPTNPPPAITYTPELPTAPPPGDPRVEVVPGSGTIPTTYTLEIRDFDPNENVTVRIISVDQNVVVNEFIVTMDGNGNLDTTWSSSTGDPTGSYIASLIGGNGENTAVGEFEVN